MCINGGKESTSAFKYKKFIIQQIGTIGGGEIASMFKCKKLTTQKIGLCSQLIHIVNLLRIRYTGQIWIYFLCGWNLLHFDYFALKNWWWVPITIGAYSLIELIHCMDEFAMWVNFLHGSICCIFFCMDQNLLCNGPFWFWVPTLIGSNSLHGPICYVGQIAAKVNSLCGTIHCVDLFTAWIKSTAS